jgi:hypothetical protein
MSVCGRHLCGSGHGQGSCEHRNELQVAYNAGNFSTTLLTHSFSNTTLLPGGNYLGVYKGEE